MVSSSGIETSLRRNHLKSKETVDKEGHRYPTGRYKSQSVLEYKGPIVSNTRSGASNCSVVGRSLRMQASTTREESHLVLLVGVSRQKISAQMAKSGKVTSKLKEDLIMGSFGQP